MTRFKDKFYNAIQEAVVANHEENSMEFKDDDFRWAETKLGEDSPTGKPRIYVNHKKFMENKAGRNYLDEMLLGEGLHLIKEIDPERAEKLYEAAVNDPETLQWLRESYKYETNRGEKRKFVPWVKNSRLDQIIGGYFLGGNKSSVPTMKDWPTERLPYGTIFKQELEKLKKDLDLK